MKRYVLLPVRSWTSHQEDFQERPSMSVYVKDEEPIATGLLDQFGNKIYLVLEAEPIGFCGKRND